MFVTTDATIMTMLLNVIFQKGKDPKLVVEQLDRTLDECLVLPEKRFVRFCSTQVRRISRRTLGGRAASLSSEVRESGKGTPSFEVSKRKALDRANSWQVPKHLLQVRRMSGNGPGSASRRSEPVEPMYVGDHVLETRTSHTADSVASSTAEEHLRREVAVTCK